MKCTKIAYPTEQAALAARIAIKRKRELTLKAYCCRDCKKWHLGNNRATRVANLDRIFKRLGM